MTLDDFVLRPALATDADLLFAWVNAPDVLAAKANTSGPIDEATHRAWFARQLADGDCRIWIVEIADRPVGQARLWRVGAAVVIDISIAPAVRRSGLAGKALECAMEEWPAGSGDAVFRANVKPSNAASIALFTALGFGEVAPAEGLRVFERPISQGGRPWIR